MWQRVWAITQKEFFELFHDRGLFTFLLIAPLIQLILYAAVVHTDIHHIPMAVADQSMTPDSRSFLDTLVHSDYFDITSVVSGQSGLMRAIDRGQASLGILIPPKFAPDIRFHRAKVLMLVDGSNSFTTSTAYGTANAISQAYASGLLPQRAAPLNLHIQVLYNPDLKDLWFVVPGMIVGILQGINMNLTSMAVVREREMGTIEALLVTPIRPFELMLGKTIPNLIIAYFNMGSILCFSILILGVPFRGNLLLFFALSTLFAFSSLGIGLAISTIAQTQMQAQQFGFMFNLVGMFLGGFLFPAYALPLVLRILSYIFPITYFLPMTRAIFSKGIGIGVVWEQVIALTILLIVILFSASRLFRQSLD